jgi:hypothetical protein
MKELFDRLESLPPEKMRNCETYVVAGINAGEIVSKFYFDKDSGYLLRILRYTKTPLGQNPTQIDNEDYRDQDGLKVPFLVTISRPNSQLTIRIDQVKFNIPLDDERFRYPARPEADQPSL